MLYLASLSDLSKIPNDCTKLFIALKPIKNMDKYNLIHIPKLTPSSKLLYDIKQNNITWQEYVKQFRKEMIDKQNILDFVQKKLLTENICFICYCTSKECHRYILGHYFEELGFYVKSI